MTGQVTIPISPPILQASNVTLSHLLVGNKVMSGIHSRGVEGLPPEVAVSRKRDANNRGGGCKTRVLPACDGLPTLIPHDHAPSLSPACLRDLPGLLLGHAATAPFRFLATARLGLGGGEGELRFCGSHKEPGMRVSPVAHARIEITTPDGEGRRSFPKRASFPGAPPRPSS